MFASILLLILCIKSEGVLKKKGEKLIFKKLRK